MILCRIAADGTQINPLRFFKSRRQSAFVRLMPDKNCPLVFIPQNIIEIGPRISVNPDIGGGNLFFLKLLQTILAVFIITKISDNGNRQPEPRGGNGGISGIAGSIDNVTG